MMADDIRWFSDKCDQFFVL